MPTRRMVLVGVGTAATVGLAGCYAMPETTHCEGGCDLLEEASVTEGGFSSSTDYELQLLFKKAFTGRVVAKVYTPDGAYIESKENDYEGVRSVTFAFEHERTGDVTLRYEVIPDGE